jgi:predicted nucleic acid-binding protein
LILLDTSVLIGMAPEGWPVGQVSLSAVSYAELALGVMVATDMQARQSRQSRLYRLDSVGMEWLPFDRQAGDGYAVVATAIHRVRPAHSRSKDIMLAGQAYSLGASLATLNVKDFVGLSGLIEVITPSSDGWITV